MDTENVIQFVMEYYSATKKDEMLSLVTTWT
jgi:hypothetical protein